MSRCRYRPIEETRSLPPSHALPNNWSSINGYPALCAVRAARPPRAVRNTRRNAPRLERIAPDDGRGEAAGGYMPVGHCEKCPVILPCGAHAKGLTCQEDRPAQWKEVIEEYPRSLRGSTNKYRNGKVADP